VFIECNLIYVISKLGVMILGHPVLSIFTGLT